MHYRLTRQEAIQLEAYCRNQIFNLRSKLTERWARVAYGQMREFICHIRLHHLGDAVSFIDFDRFSLLPQNSFLLTDNYNTNLFLILELKAMKAEIPELNFERYRLITCRFGIPFAIIWFRVDDSWNSPVDWLLITEDTKSIEERETLSLEKLQQKLESFIK